MRVGDCTQRFRLGKSWRMPGPRELLEPGSPGSTSGQYSGSKGESDHTRDVLVLATFYIPSFATLHDHSPSYHDGHTRRSRS